MEWSKFFISFFILQYHNNKEEKLVFSTLSSHSMSTRAHNHCLHLLEVVRTSVRIKDVKLKDSSVRLFETNIRMPVKASIIQVS